jgi:hypothetical protein
VFVCVRESKRERERGGVYVYVRVCTTVRLNGYSFLFKEKNNHPNAWRHLYVCMYVYVCVCIY